MKEKSKSSFLKIVAGRYPKRKMCEHKGDSTIIYEGGNRSTKYPPGIKDLVEETEGREADSMNTFEVDVRNVQRGGSGYPGDETVTRVSAPPDTGYPNIAWMRKVLCRYRPITKKIQ